MDLINELRINQIDAHYIDKSPTYHIFEQNHSARGAEITKEEYGYEIRMTILSNLSDYLLCNHITKIVCNHVGGTPVDESGKKKNANSFFSDFEISQKIKEEVQIIFELINQGKDIGIIGPVREVTFGRRIRKKLSEFQGSDPNVVQTLFDTILIVQYPPENFAPFSNLLRTTNPDGGIYYTQVLTNSKDMVIEKVEEYAISSDMHGTIYLNAKDFISIIPDEWILLDEYIILAKQLVTDKWNEFTDRAKAVLH